MNHQYTVNVEEKDDGSRLDSWLSKRYNELNFNTVNIMCRKGIFRINGARIKSSYRLKFGDFIKIPPFLLKKKNKDLKIESPYNTYKYKGLPPGPINSPGLDALKAAIKPEKTNYLYFVSDGSGNHIFTTNVKDHNKAKVHLKRKRKEMRKKRK